MVAPTAVQIFERAEAVWRAQRLPPYVEFTTNVVNQRDPVRIIIRTQDGAAYSQTIPPPPPPEEKELRYIPGVILTSPGRGGRKPLGFPGAYLTGPDGAALGFCVSNLHCAGVLADNPFAPVPPATGSALKIIASVRSYANPYVITLAGIEDYYGSEVYDLKLTPRMEPWRYQLRGLLIDAHDFRTWQMTYDIPQRWEIADATIKYDFGHVGDSWYLLYICVYVPPIFPTVPWGCSQQSTALWDFAFPTGVPDYLFDPQRFRQHLKAVTVPTPKPRNSAAN